MNEQIRTGRRNAVFLWLKLKSCFHPRLKCHYHMYVLNTPPSKVEWCFNFSWVGLFLKKYFPSQFNIPPISLPSLKKNKISFETSIWKYQLLVEQCCSLLRECCVSDWKIPFQGRFMFQWVCYEVVEWQIRLHEIVKCLPKLVLGSNLQPIFEQGTSRNFICWNKCCCRKYRSSTEIVIICFPIKKKKAIFLTSLHKVHLFMGLGKGWVLLGTLGSISSAVKIPNPVQ